MKANKKKFVYFLLAYTLVFTYPVIFFIGSKIPAKFADTYQVWGKALEFRNTIDDLGLFGAIAWQFKHFRFSPIEGIGWLQNIFGSYGGYNITWLSSFFLAALGMYLLVLYLTQNRLAAGISALIFSFSPFHFSQGIATNFGTMHYEWIPFFIYFLLRFLRCFRFFDFLGAVGFLLLIAVTEHQLLAFTGVFTILFVVAYLLKNRRIFLNPRMWLYFSGGLVVVFLAVKLLFGGLLSVTKSQDNYLDPGSDQVRKYSTDAIDFFIPSSLHPIWGEKFQYLREDTEANATGRKTNYVGYTVFILALISLLGAGKRSAIKIFFFAAGVFFSVLALGPYLHWKGQIHEDILMPYTFLYKYVPFWYIIRTVNRIYVIALLCFAVSAGFGADSIFRLLDRRGERKKDAAASGSGLSPAAERRIQSREAGETPSGKTEEKHARASSALAIFLFAAVSLEYLSAPVPMLSMGYSKFYDELKEKEGVFSIIDIPGATSYDYGSRLMHYNQVHRKNNLAGMDFARVVKDRWAFQRNTPIVNDLLYSLPTGGKPPSKEIINDYYYNLATKILNHYDIRYLIVSKAYLLTDGKQFDGEAYENTTTFIEGQIDTKKVFEDEYLVAYEVQPSDYLDGWFLAMELVGDYWGEKEGAEGSVSRWARDGASMKLVNMGDTPQSIDLTFTTSIKNLRRVSVFMDDVEKGSFRINEKKETHSIRLDNVEAGEHRIVFHIADQDGKTVESFELGRGVKISNVRTISAKK